MKIDEKEINIAFTIKTKTVLIILALIGIIMIYATYYVFIEKGTPLINSWIDEVTVILILIVLLVILVKYVIIASIEVYKYIKELFF